VAKLNLDFDHLETLFDLDFKKNELRLKPDEYGNPRTSINIQQFYNWYRQKQQEFMSAENAVDGCGFIGKQPIVVFKKNLRLIVPPVERFTVHGLIATEKEGVYPFSVDQNTAIVMSQYARPIAYVFLSHSSVDKPFVRTFRELLYPVCDTFFDETDIRPGESITARLNQELERTNLLVLIYSVNARKSDWVQKEWASMLHMEKPLVLVRIDDEPIPPLLKDIKGIDAQTSPQSAADEIAIALGALGI